MADLKPQPSIEILAARLFNDISNNPEKYPNLEDLDETKLFEMFSEAQDLPNKTTELDLQSPQERMGEIKDEVEDLISGDEDKLDFSRPKTIKKYLDRFVEGQDAAKRRLSTIVSDYIGYDIRKGLILLGPSGSGKTYSLEVLAKELNIPFVKKSLAQATGAGYKGQNLTEGLDMLIGAEKGILFLDELDKIANNSQDGIVGFGEQVQNELLEIVSGGIVKVEGADPNAPRKKGKNGKNGKLVEQPKKAVIYGPASMAVAGQVNVAAHLNKLRNYFIERGVPVDFVSTEDGFDKIPAGLAPYFRKIQGKANAPVVDWFCVQYEDKVIEAPTKAKLDAHFKEEDEKKGEEAEGTGEKDKDKEKEIPPGYLDMSKILVVTAGAFHGNKRSPSLYRIIQRRLGGNTCKLNETELLEQLTDQDLIEYGLKTELVARLPVRAVLKPHGVDGLFRILKYSEDSPLDRLKKQFDKYGIQLNFDDPSLFLLASYAHEGIGVRGIEKVLEDLVGEMSFNREQYAGRTMNFTRRDLEKKLEKKVQFERVDKYEVDWFDPNSIKGYLDLFVPEQQEAKMEIAKAFHLYHLKMSNPLIDLPMANVLVVGPTGSGKTYMINLLAEKAELPIAATKATGKVATGFQGEKLSDVFGGLSETQKYGVIYIDEADKILLDTRNPMNTDLVGMLEDGEVEGRKTKNYLFILSGAFQDVYNEDGKVSREGLIKRGVREEILGRIPIFVNLAPPTIDTMVKVLKGPKSLMDQYRNYFRTRDWHFELEDGVYEAIAKSAIKTTLGFRALKTVCSKVFGEYMMHPDQYVSGNFVKVKTDDVVKILGLDQVDKYQSLKEKLTGGKDVKDGP